MRNQVCNVLGLIWGEVDVKAYWLGMICTDFVALMSPSHLAQLSRRQTQVICEDRLSRQGEMGAIVFAV